MVAEARANACLAPCCLPVLLPQVHAHAAHKAVKKAVLLHTHAYRHSPGCSLPCALEYALTHWATHRELERQSPLFMESVAGGLLDKNDGLCPFEGEFIAPKVCVREAQGERVDTVQGRQCARVRVCVCMCVRVCQGWQRVWRHMASATVGCRARKRPRWGARPHMPCFHYVCFLTHTRPRRTHVQPGTGAFHSTNLGEFIGGVVGLVLAASVVAFAMVLPMLLVRQAGNGEEGREAGGVAGVQGKHVGRCVGGHGMGSPGACPGACRSDHEWSDHE